MNKLVRIILTEEEKALLKKLRDSITPNVIEEWKKNKMKLIIQKDYVSHPNVKGYEDVK
tara:strand:+ start:1196 stop:1372 length:177 start_codon:yes stop_codon:yes gene_type:complete